MQVLQKHYDGGVNSDDWIKADTHKDKNTFYKVETSFYFEDDCTAIIENCKLLKQYSVPAYEVDKVKHCP